MAVRYAPRAPAASPCYIERCGTGVAAALRERALTPPPPPLPLGHGKATDGQFGYAAEGTICATRKGDGSDGGCAEACGAKCSLFVRSSGQVQWRCQNADCRAFVTVTRGSPAWRACIVRFNAAQSSEKTKIAL